MIKLYGKAEKLSGPVVQTSVLTLTSNQAMPERLRSRYAFVSNGAAVPPGFPAAFARDVGLADETTARFKLPAELLYLKEGDIVRLNGSSGNVHTLFRKGSQHNTVLLTEQCNNYCLMCSQPPKNVDDSWLMDEALQLLELIPASTQHLGFSGGEPTLYGQRFIDLIQRAKNLLPTTHLDVLSNGRAFHDLAFANALGAVNHPNCTIGIPIYSDDPVRHDYVVQSEGAFDETVRGILNLKRARQKVEIRIVIHRQTIDRLVQTCEFIARNLIFVDHVALMGLEITGFTRANLDKLWIDPYEYKDTLSQAVQVLNTYGIRSSIYNHQLCVINRDAESNYTKSISDWKNEYVEACGGCARANECGGFFTSSKLHKHSVHIKPFVHDVALEIC